MKQLFYSICVAGMLFALPVWAQDNSGNSGNSDDSDAYYAAEEACDQQATNQSEKDYYEVFNACMRQHGFTTNEGNSDDQGGGDNEESD